MAHRINKQGNEMRSAIAYGPAGKIASRILQKLVFKNSRTENLLYIEQDIIELFNGDQTKIFQVVADALNLDMPLNLILKIEIQLMEQDKEDAELLKALECEKLCEEVERYDRDPFGLKRACGWLFLGRN